MSANTRETNIDIWESIYKTNQNILGYPDDVLIRVGHHTLKNGECRAVLDYGFGTGSNLIHFIDRGFEVSGVEVSESAIRYLQARLVERGSEADLRSVKEGKLPFENQRFDAVVAWQVLYYNTWQTLSDAIREIERVLRPGGIFIGTMAAPGDFSHINSVPKGDSTYESIVPNQLGATILIVEKEQLARCFPDRELDIGSFGFEFGTRVSRHWIVTYRKPEYEALP
ncbi:methyltransferase family protein [Paenibacillus taihuensis]|uniref:Methyltransferase family protein n=1 Tax=Paenibacillus taihuensis TaxID=1156355 RepID=A0A3D9S5E4_9BACL|nr:class I SAM-dependent methyltransferase [Paenibacillus taihuensis]REE84506.1 methyltransferase family protein [Paenibacillus taihuensis]